MFDEEQWKRGEERSNGGNKSLVYTTKLLSYTPPFSKSLWSHIENLPLLQVSPPPFPRVWDMRLCPKYPTCVFFFLGLTPIWEVKGLVAGLLDLSRVKRVGLNIGCFIFFLTLVSFLFYHLWRWPTWPGRQNVPRIRWTANMRCITKE